MKLEQNVGRLIVRVVCDAEVSIAMRYRVCVLLLFRYFELSLETTYLFLYLFCSPKLDIRDVKPR